MNTPPLSRRAFGLRIAELGLAGSAVANGLPAWADMPRPLPNPVVAVPPEMRPKPGLILVSDQQLLDLRDPDKPVDISLSSTPQVATLRQLCEQAKAGHGRKIVLAFDQFFEQYRPGQKGKPRTLTPDSDAYIECLAKIGQTLRPYGLGLELSLLSPLEIGAAYAKATGESGRWVQYREGYRNPRSGRFSVSLWQQLRWTNNKGTIELARDSVQAYAFRERQVGGGRFYHVAPEQIVRLDHPLVVEEDGEGDEGQGGRRRRITVLGEGGDQARGLDRVLVVVRYRTPEMDYFSDRALPYLKGLVDRYHAAGVPLAGLYSDEVHIQQDWHYDAHHDEGQLAIRYLTPNLARRFAAKYGAEFEDFEKFLVYFAYAQHAFDPTLDARLPALHVLAPNPDGVARTALLRRRYFDLLDRTVVDLFVAAKRHAEGVFGRELEATAHATWAESPTIDFWSPGDGRPMNPMKYEYTPNFLWSNTVHQASAACDDYFRWGEFLTGGGTDHAEGGWSDRDYYGLALGCSLGITNPNRPYAYAAGWGWPAAVGERYEALQAAYGVGGHPAFQAIAEKRGRDVEVLMLYPLSLVACEERFGSWMAQYGYATYATPEVLLTRGKLTDDGAILLGGRRFTTLAILFEPLPPAGLLPLIEDFVERGGRLVWSGPPPRVDMDGTAVLDRWSRLIGAGARHFHLEGQAAAGSVVEFTDALGPVPPQTILTDFLVDQVHPIDPAEGSGATVVARVAGRPVGLHRAKGRGTVTFLGFRPRDDQSASLGHESRTWFEVLKALGAYPKSREDAPTNDNPSVVSRESPHLATRFPNGTIILAAHYRSHVESWGGGFQRDEAEDRAAIARNPLPPDAVELDERWVGGHRVTYRGRLLVAFRVDDSGRLIAFGGQATGGIRIDGREHRLADRPLDLLAFAPVPEPRRVPGGASMMIWLGNQGESEVRIPAPPGLNAPRVYQQGAEEGSAGAEVPSSVRGGVLALPGRHDFEGERLLYVVPG
ncbi:hypothetical protein OJF2_35290 [Aquisphaera giovannonii]|uniref:Uncharacterized protein n=1 Tax=Aquisphaera giovannonii TaxID=406548 RepID=A0A5B9W406_9BACT|nr:hypothetical protein [Aquisphaera giovannonii]QEH34984.1 hypothetical protein OJF2_35290 [Aquisphaera giovannonii]